MDRPAGRAPKSRPTGPKKRTVGASAPEKDVASSKSTAVRLRKYHRSFLAALEQLSEELHILHRIWYKGRLQYRHMVWWRPVQRVLRHGSISVTGSLAQSVPLGSGARPRRTLPTASSDASCVALFQSMAAAYYALWDDSSPAAWDRYVGASSLSLPRREAQPRASTVAPAHRAAMREAARALKADLAALVRACHHCFAYVWLLTQTRPSPSLHASRATTRGDGHGRPRAVRSHGCFV